jgi:hypothetical protein
MCFLRRTAGYTRWDHNRNEDVLRELQISQMTYGLGAPQNKTAASKKQS